MLAVLGLVLILAATSVYIGRPAAPAPEPLSLPTEDGESRAPMAAGATATAGAVAATTPGGAARPIATGTRAPWSTLGFTVAVRPLDQAEADRVTELTYAGVYDQLLIELDEIPDLDLVVLESDRAEYDPAIVDFLLEPRAGSDRSREELAKFRVDWTAIRGGNGSWVAAEMGFGLAVEMLARGAAAALRQYPFPPEDGLVLALEGIVLNSTFPLEQRLEALEQMRRSSDRYAFVGRDERRPVALAAVEIVSTMADAEIRGHTWRAMTKLEDPYLVAPLTDTVLQDPSEFVRIEAVKLLSADYGEDPQAQSALEYALVNDLSSLVRMHARWESLDDAGRQALLAATLLDTGRTDAERFELLLAEVRDIRRYIDRRSAMALAEISARARPTTQAPLASETTDDVSAADVVPLLIEMLEDLRNEPLIRSTMAASLGRHIEEPGVYAALQRAARNETSDQVRMEISRITWPYLGRRPRN